jgi:hypothetical protein
MTREWMIKVRFWPLAFILLGIVSSVYTSNWYMSLADRGDMDWALPGALVAFTTQMITKFTDTSGDG